MINKYLKAFFHTKEIVYYEAIIINNHSNNCLLVYQRTADRTVE